MVFRYIDNMFFLGDTGKRGWGRWLEDDLQRECHVLLYSVQPTGLQEHSTFQTAPEPGSMAPNPAWCVAWARPSSPAVGANGPHPHSAMPNQPFKHLELDPITSEYAVNLNLRKERSYFNVKVISWHPPQYHGNRTGWSHLCSHGTVTGPRATRPRVTLRSRPSLLFINTKIKWGLSANVRSCRKTPPWALINRITTPLTRQWPGPRAFFRFAF